MKIIIAGSRTFNDYNMLQKEVIDILKETKHTRWIEKEDLEIVSGTANGADKLGERFANQYGLRLKRMPADWTIGKQAGYIRNYEMANYIKENGVCIVFWDGVSKGTKHMIDIAKKEEIHTYIIRTREEC